MSQADETVFRFKVLGLVQFFIPHALVWYMVAWLVPEFVCIQARSEKKPFQLFREPKNHTYLKYVKNLISV